MKKTAGEGGHEGGSREGEHTLLCVCSSEVEFDFTNKLIVPDH